MIFGGIFFAVVLFFILFFLRSSYEKKTIKKTEYTVSLPEAVTVSGAGNASGAPKDRRIVYISDLHETVFGNGNEKLSEALKEASPDILILGGDMLCALKGKIPPMKSLSLLLSVLPENVPVYFAEGNHEGHMRADPSEYPGYPELLSLLENANVKILSRKETEIFPNIFLSSVALPQEAYQIGRKRALPEALFSLKASGTLGIAEKNIPAGKVTGKTNEAGTGFHIACIHSPLYAEEGIRAGYDVVLSGHFHGGTVYLGKLGGLMTPQFGFFEKKAQGEHRLNGKQLFVSRGLGTHSVKIRFNDFPEVMCISLKAHTKSSQDKI